MASNYTEYYIQLVNMRTKTWRNDDTGKYYVFTANSPSAETIYSDDRGTTITQPATMTDGEIRFFTVSSTTTVDITIQASNGVAVFLQGLTPSMHRVEIDTESIRQVLVTHYDGNTACGTVVDTSFDIPQGAMVQDVFLHTTTNGTGAGLDVGNSTTVAGYLSAATVSVTGWKIYQDPVWTTGTGDSNDVISSTQPRGSLLVTFASGSTTNLGGSGWWANKQYKVADATSAASLVYRLANTNSGGTGSGYIYVIYDRLPTQGN